MIVPELSLKTCPIVVEKFRTEDLSGLDALDYLRWRQANPAPRVIARANRKGGRPRKYKTAAERQRAYRDRSRALRNPLAAD
jgi:hypothetical protein